MSQNRLSGVKIAPTAPIISNLCFADFLRQTTRVGGLLSDPQHGISRQGA